VPDADSGRHAAALVAELVVQRVGVEIRAPGHRVQVADTRVAAAHVGLGVGADMGLHRGDHELAGQERDGRAELEAVGAQAGAAGARAVVLEECLEPVEVVGHAHGGHALRPTAGGQARADPGALECRGGREGTAVQVEHGHRIVRCVGARRFPERVEEAARQAAVFRRVVADHVAPARIAGNIAAILRHPQRIEQRRELGRAAEGVELRRRQEHRIRQPADADLAEIALQPDVGVARQHGVARGAAAGAGVGQEEAFQPEVGLETAAQVLAPGHAPERGGHAAALHPDRAGRRAAGLGRGDVGVDDAVELDAARERRRQRQRQGWQTRVGSID